MKGFACDVRFDDKKAERRYLGERVGYVSMSNILLQQDLSWGKPDEAVRCFLWMCNINPSSASLLSHFISPKY